MDDRTAKEHEGPISIEATYKEADAPRMIQVFETMPFDRIKKFLKSRRPMSQRFTAALLRRIQEGQQARRWALITAVDTLELPKGRARCKALRRLRKAAARA